MGKKATAKTNPARDDLAQRLAECAAQAFIVREGDQLEPRHLECEIRDRLAAMGLVEQFREILNTSLKAPASSKPPVIGDVDEMLAKLRAAGLDAWDQIEDPEAFLRELRGGEVRDTAGEIVAALAEAGAQGWDAPRCELTADPQLAIVKLLMGNAATSVKRHSVHTPVPVQEAAAYIRRVVEAIG